MNIVVWFNVIFFYIEMGGGGSENRKESPNTRVTNKCTKVTKKEETKNLRKPVLTSKIVNPFTRALTPPFIGRRSDFDIPRIPSNLENIPSVNTYLNVFYIPWFAGLISYIYKPALVYTSNPDFWDDVFDLTSPKFLKLYYRWSSSIEIPESRFSQILELRKFPVSWISPDSSRPETDSKLANRNPFDHYFRVSSES
jgi:hypothetical protein